MSVLIDRLLNYLHLHQYMSQKTIYSYGGPELGREYSGQVDFRVSCKHGGWEVSTFIPNANCIEFSNGLLNDELLDVFDITVHELKIAKMAQIIFRPNSLDEQGKYRRHLLKYINNRGLKIIWKESLHGYEINTSGDISRKWKLNPLSQSFRD